MQFPQCLFVVLQLLTLLTMHVYNNNYYCNIIVLEITKNLKGVGIAIKVRKQVAS